MSAESKFRTMRHIETVRNFISVVVTALLRRAESHDQSKLQSPEAEVFAQHKHQVFGSEAYSRNMARMKPAIDHHNKHNRHHPEFFEDGICGMHLIDLLEMMCDWKASTLIHPGGDLMLSIEINQKRFGYSDEMARILKNTASWLNQYEHYTNHWVDES